MWHTHTRTKKKSWQRKKEKRHEPVTNDSPDCYSNKHKATVVCRCIPRWLQFLPIWWVVFARLQNASGVFWRQRQQRQICGCLTLLYVPEASLSSADKQLEGSVWHLSEFVIFPHCMLHITHSDFDSLMPIFDLRETRPMLTCTQKNGMWKYEMHGYYLERWFLWF